MPVTWPFSTTLLLPRLKLHISRWISLGVVFALRITWGYMQKSYKDYTIVSKLFLSLDQTLKLLFEATLSMNHLHDSVLGKWM